MRDAPRDPAPAGPRSSGALWIPFATVVVVLVALALVPLAVTLRSDTARKQMRDRVGPARTAVNVLQRHIGATFYADSGARAAVGDDVRALDALVEPLDDSNIDAALTRLHTALRPGHDPADVPGLAALAATGQVDRALSRYTDREVATMTRGRTAEMQTNAVLIVLALLGVVMLGRAGLRTARLATLTEMQRQALAAAHAERETVLRGVTHDLRNPLAAARGHIELVADGMLGSVNARQADSLARSRRLITATLDGVDDLLAVALADAGRLAIRPRRVALDEIAHDAVAEHAALAASAGLSLRCSVVGTVQGASLDIETDPARVHQVIGNLLSNACKYTPAGGCIELAGGVGPAPGGGWLAVRDSGPGVPPEDYDRVFDEAVRLVGTRHIDGAGVGLAAARRLARALGGELTVGAAPQGGAAFTLTLPARIAGSD